MGKTAERSEPSVGDSGNFGVGRCDSSDHGTVHDPMTDEAIDGPTGTPEKRGHFDGSWRGDFGSVVVAGGSAGTVRRGREQIGKELIVLSGGIGNIDQIVITGGFTRRAFHLRRG